MSNLREKFLTHIAVTTKLITSEIIKLIENDEYWLGILGIQVAKSTSGISVSDLVKIKLKNPENIDSIDNLLKYVIGDYLIDNDDFHLIKHESSVDSHWQRNALFVFKCENEYLCYHYGNALEVVITDNPVEFCRKAAEEIESNYKLEEENLKDDYFKDSDHYNDLNWNFNFSEF